MPTKNTGNKALPKKVSPPTKSVQKSKYFSNNTNFEQVFLTLKQIMASYADELKITVDEPKKYYLVTKALSWRGGPMYFGAVIWGKAYVSYHLFPLYVYPDLKKTLSPGLKQRMQGKACLNFRTHDEELFAELKDLTKTGLESFRKNNLL